MGMLRTCGRICVRDHSAVEVDVVTGTYVVLLTELLGEGSAHDDTALAGGGTEVSLSRLSSRAGDTYCEDLVSIGIQLGIMIW